YAVRALAAHLVRTAYLLGTHGSDPHRCPQQSLPRHSSRQRAAARRPSPPPPFARARRCALLRLRCSLLSGTRRDRLLAAQAPETNQVRPKRVRRAWRAHNAPSCHRENAPDGRAGPGCHSGPLRTPSLPIPRPCVFPPRRVLLPPVHGRVPRRPSHGFPLVPPPPAPP